jgi:hypothetical protein
MGNVDIEIYMNNFKGFFKKNPDQLQVLIGNIESDYFFSEIRKLAEKNLSEEKELAPTRTQMIELLVQLNTGKDRKEITKAAKPFIYHHMGKISMN